MPAPDADIQAGQYADPNAYFASAGISDPSVHSFYAVTGAPLPVQYPAGWNYPPYGNGYDGVTLARMPPEARPGSITLPTIFRPGDEVAVANNGYYLGPDLPVDPSQPALYPPNVWSGGGAYGPRSDYIDRGPNVLEGGLSPYSVPATVGHSHHMLHRDHAQIFPAPHLLTAIMQTINESLGPTAPLLHYPSFALKVLAGRADTLLRDTFIWAAYTSALRKNDPLAQEIEKSWGFDRTAALETSIDHAAQARFAEWDRNGRHRIGSDDKDLRRSMLALLQSCALACVVYSRGGKAELGRAFFGMALPLHAALDFEAVNCAARADYRADCDAMTLSDWIAAEEECRACVIVSNMDAAISALDDARHSLSAEATPNCAVPCPDAAFAAFPAAFDPSWGIDEGTLAQLGIDIAPSNEMVGPILDRIQAGPTWNGGQRYPFSIINSVLWVDLPVGSPERSAAAQLAMGGFLSNGPLAAALQMVILNNKVRRLRRWFGEHMLAIHKFGRWDESLRKDAKDGDEEQAAVPIDLANEANAHRTDCERALQDFWDFLPIVVKGLDQTGDGIGLLEVGEERWGPIAGHRLLHWLLWYHADEILLTSPRSWIYALDHPDTSWTSSPSFLRANAHAIAVSRLIRSVVPAFAGNSWLQSERFPASILLPILSAGMVHVHYLAQFRQAGGTDAQSAVDVIKELVVDIQACLQSLAHNVGYWENARMAYEAFLRLAEMEPGDWAKEAQQLRALQGVSKILEPGIGSDENRSGEAGQGGDE